MQKQFLSLHIIFTTFVFFCSSYTFAQQGAIDTSFNPTDIGFGNGDAANGLIQTTVIQSDGKIIIGGNFTAYNGTTRNHIARLNVNGSLDAGFNPGIGANNDILTTTIQNDGKIIIGGYFTSYGGTPRNSLARINADGSLDATFNSGIGANTHINSTAIQSNGQIIITGEFLGSYGTAINGIARLNVNGSLDGTFTTGFGVNGEIFTTRIQSDGKIIIGGNFTGYDTIIRNNITRLFPNGKLDTTFNMGGIGASSIIRTTAIQSNGNIIIGGDFTTYNGIPRNRIARIDANGNLDADFNPGTGAANSVKTVGIQSDGKIIIGGNLFFYNGTAIKHIARINTNGSLDASFNIGIGPNNDVQTIAIQSDGKIIIGGDFIRYNNYTRNHVARINADGSIAVPFNPGTGANDVILATAIQTDGKIIIGGDFTTYNGTVKNRIARLNADGSLDTAFSSGSGVISDIGLLSPNLAKRIVKAIAIETDGKILIGGFIESYNGTLVNRIIRLNANGSLDPGFSSGSGPDDDVNSIAIQNNGKIIIGGRFIDYNGTARNGIARLNTDGSLDLTFNPGSGAGSGANQGVNTIAIQSDGKIIIGGRFTSYNGASRNYIARLLSDGNLDFTFDPGVGPDDEIATSAIQTDGRILVGGDLSTYNGTNRNGIARINLDGSLDVGFDPGAGLDIGFVSCVALQTDGKIIIGGNFTNYNGVSRNRIARLNFNGSLDSLFNPGVGANLDIETLAVQTDGKIIIGGDFTSYDGTGRNRIARVIVNTPPGTFVWRGTTNVWSNPANWETGMVPGVTNNVILRPGLPIYPTIYSSTEIKSLSVQNGAILTVAPNVGLKINGH